MPRADMPRSPTMRRIEPVIALKLAIGSPIPMNTTLLSRTRAEAATTWATISAVDRLRCSPP